MDDQFELEERVIASWVKLTGMLKNTRITRGMIYNEAIVMLMVYRRYREDGVGAVAFREIVAETKMLKSLVNRTIASLVGKGFLLKSDGEDRRTTFVRPVPEALPRYLEVHSRTLDLVRKIVDIIGEEDAEAFVRLTEKLALSDLSV